MKRLFCILVAVTTLTACDEPEAPGSFQTAPVIRRDIVVSVEAAGIIEPALTVEVKSKASGEILGIEGDAGDKVSQGALLVRIDKRSPRNQLAQGEAELEAALARRSIAEAQSRRSKTLFESGTLNEVEYEQTILEFANAKAEVIRSEVAVENARIALDDADVRAPMTGTIIEKLVEKGQVISSPTMDVGGGTLLLIMADLSSVEVNALVDETDIGKIQLGQPVTVTVTAYPNQPFAGTVSKIEPKAQEDQTVTTFSVLIVLDNTNGLLRPGMNADVEIRIAERRNVVAVPTIALKVDQDVPIASRLVGQSAEEVRRRLTESSPAADSVIKREAGGYTFSNQYWVFVDRAATPVATTVETGLTDLNYSEVLSGLEEGDEVLMLPSSGLIRSQERFQKQMRQFTGIPGMNGKKDKKDEGKKSTKKPSPGEE